MPSSVFHAIMKSYAGCPIILSVLSVAFNRLAITLTESPGVMVVVGPVHSGRKRTWRGCKVMKIVGEG